MDRFGTVVGSVRGSGENSTLLALTPTRAAHTDLRDLVADAERTGSCNRVDRLLTANRSLVGERPLLLSLLRWRADRALAQTAPDVAPLLSCAARIVGAGAALGRAAERARLSFDGLAAARGNADIAAAMTAGARAAQFDAAAVVFGYFAVNRGRENEAFWQTFARAAGDDELGRSCRVLSADDMVCVMRTVVSALDTGADDATSARAGAEHARALASANINAARAESGARARQSQQALRAHTAAAAAVMGDGKERTPAQLLRDLANAAAQTNEKLAAS